MKREVLSRPIKPQPPLSAVLVSVLLVVSVSMGLGAGIITSEDWLLRVVRDTRIGASIVKRSYQRPLTFLLSQNSRNNIVDGRPPSLKEGEAWLEIRMGDGSGK